MKNIHLIIIIIALFSIEIDFSNLSKDLILEQNNNSFTFLAESKKISALKIYLNKQSEVFKFKISSKNIKEKELVLQPKIEKQHPPFTEIYYYLSFSTPKTEKGEIINLKINSEDNLNSEQSEDIKIIKIKLFYKKNLFSIISDYFEKISNAKSINANEKITIILLISLIFSAIKIVIDSTKIMFDAEK